MPIDPIIGGALIDAGANFLNIQKNNENSLALARYQNAFNLEMWNRNNEYNSPKETINRLVAAGVNPRAYSQLGQFANAADAPQAASFDKKSGLAAFSELFQTMLSMKQMEALTKKAEADSDKAEADAEKARADAELSSSRKLYADDERDRALDIEEDRKIREEIYRRERGLHWDSGRGFFRDGKDIFSQQSFLDYINDVKQSRYYNSLSDKERYDLRRFENHLKRLEIDSLEFIPPQFRYIADKIFNINFSKLFK